MERIVDQSNQGWVEFDWCATRGVEQQNLPIAHVFRR